MDLNSCATSRREACIESMQSIVWNPLQDGMESSRRKCTFGDAMRLQRYHTRLRVIPYQACGLNKKFDKSKLVEFFGGERWIRTIEVGDNRFTVCPLWPLGNLPIFIGAGDWNRTHNLLITNQLLCLLSYASVLCKLVFLFSVVPRGGIEPPTRGFSVPCSTD